MTKIVVIGLDGATLDLIDPWAKEGKLPELSNLMERGVFGRLQSVLPVLSSAAWSSFMTGMNPGKHGIYDFVKRAPNSYQLRPVNHRHIRGRSIWKIMSELGKKVIVVNVPITYPPEEVNGLLISGLGTPDYKIFTYPQELSRELLSKGYLVNNRVHFQPGHEQEYLHEVNRITDNLTDAVLQFMKFEEWDFFMVVYRHPDEMAHFFWRDMDQNHPQHQSEDGNPYKDAILNYYQRIDQAIGQIILTCGVDSNIIIMSDHGSGPLYKDVLLNNWLQQKGWLVLNQENGLDRLSQKTFRAMGLTRSNISSSLRRMRLGRLEQAIKSVLGNRIEVLPVSTQKEFPTAINWKLTKAYSFGYHGQIYINLSGREPEGIVSQGDEYNQLCHDIGTALMTLIDPEDGIPVVDQVVQRSEAYYGPNIEEAPDLIVIMRELAYITRSGYEFGQQSDEIFTSPHHYQSGSHRMDGTLIMAGPDILRAGYKGEVACLMDLAPTILYLLGCPVPGSMDGNVLSDWLTSEWEVQVTQGDTDVVYSPTSEDVLTHDQEMEIIQRLKDLGYLE